MSHLHNIVIEVDVPGVQGPTGPAGTGADPSTLRGGGIPPDHNIGTSYVIGSRVTMNALEYVAVNVPAIGEFDASDWQLVSTQANSIRLDLLEKRIEALEG